MDNASHCSREGSSHCVPQKAVVIGLYGISGVGSAVIADIVPGGLEAFQSLEEGEKACWRKQAIETIRRTSIETRKIAVVTGHFMFYLFGTFPSLGTRRHSVDFTVTCGLWEGQHVCVLWLH
ncbi:uncharacterized protein AKAW2_50548S [Aspergillus luchuensis]|uniref:Uncharacterized protein n=1 Tax=Aspergillus kawachii TaxID=1069201 RepID=A0A7R8A0C3_ASPKA|nr:uncharacterized protein AKAW2_50548S [Aspergillus luchuensis]BCS00207.1 hypothetical protein AKAW2_50548S [Aspergillus luchuensis]